MMILNPQSAKHIIVIIVVILVPEQHKMIVNLVVLVLIGKNTQNHVFAAMAIMITMLRFVLNVI